MVFVNPYIIKDGKCFERKRKYLPNDVLDKIARWMFQRNAKSEDVYDCPIVKEYNLTPDNFAFDLYRDKDGKIKVGKPFIGLDKDYNVKFIERGVAYDYVYYEDIK